MTLVQQLQSGVERRWHKGQVSYYADSKESLVEFGEPYVAGLNRTWPNRSTVSWTVQVVKGIPTPVRVENVGESMVVGVVSWSRLSQAWKLRVELVPTSTALALTHVITSHEWDKLIGLKDDLGNSLSNK